MGYSSTSDSRLRRPVSRRQFGSTTTLAVLGTGVVGLALLDKPRSTYTTSGVNVSMGDPANPISAFFVRPVTGKHPAVVTWRSGQVMTEAERIEARELSEKGYAVLLIDHYAGDARSAVNDVHQATWWLKHQPEVNAKTGIGTLDWALLRLEPVTRA
jgi:hypothetical protein